MGIDLGHAIEPIVNAIGIGVAAIIGAWAKAVIGRINKASRDLDAVFPKIRRIEEKLGLNGVCDGRVNNQDRTPLVNGDIHQQGSGAGCLGGGEKNGPGV